jgi:hypothetical protein
MLTKRCSPRTCLISACVCFECVEEPDCFLTNDLNVAKSFERRCCIQGAERHRE